MHRYNTLDACKNASLLLFSGENSDWCHVYVFFFSAHACLQRHTGTDMWKTIESMQAKQLLQKKKNTTPPSLNSLSLARSGSKRVCSAGDGDGDGGRCVGGGGGGGETSAAGDGGRCVGVGGGGVSAGDGVSSAYVKKVKVGGVSGKVGDGFEVGGGGMEQCMEVEQGMGRVGTRREVEGMREEGQGGMEEGKVSGEEMIGEGEGEGEIRGFCVAVERRKRRRREEVGEGEEGEGKGKREGGVIPLSQRLLREGMEASAAMMEVQAPESDATFGNAEHPDDSDEELLSTFVDLPPDDD